MDADLLIRDVGTRLRIREPEAEQVTRGVLLALHLAMREEAAGELRGQLPSRVWPRLPRDGDRRKASRGGRSRFSRGGLVRFIGQRLAEQGVGPAGPGPRDVFARDAVGAVLEALGRHAPQADRTLREGLPEGLRPLGTPTKSRGAGWVQAKLS